VQAPSVPTSDYFMILSRFIQATRGEIGWLDYLLAKHIDHNHALVYALAAADMMLGRGDLRWLAVGQLLANVGILAVYGYCLAKAQLNRVYALVFGVFLVAQVTQLASMETWIFPFQFVVASFRLLLVGGLVLLCGALLREHRGQSLLAMGVLGVAALSHGSGIVVPGLVLAMAGLVWLHTRQAPKAWFWGALSVLAALFMWHEAQYPPVTPFTAMVNNISADQWLHVPRYLGFLLGVGLLGQNLPGWVCMVVGGAGLKIFASLTVFLGHRWRYPAIEIPLVLLGGFYAVAALLSVLLNLAYADFRGVSEITDGYFVASRYMATLSGFWVSVGLMGLLALGRLPAGWLKGLGSVALCGLLLTSVTLTTLEGQRSVKGWQRVLNEHAVTGQYVAAWGPAGFDQQTFMERLYVDAPDIPRALKGIAFQQEHRLGVFAAPVGPSQQLAPHTDAHWRRGVARTGNQCLLVDTPANRAHFVPGARVSFASGVRTVVAAETSGLFRVLTLDGEPLQAKTDGFPQRFRLLGAPNR
jgi:hypothetical protein